MCILALILGIFGTIIALMGLHQWMIKVLKNIKIYRVGYIHPTDFDPFYGRW
jgi:hypothetical protein